MPGVISRRIPFDGIEALVEWYFCGAETICFAQWKVPSGGDIPNTIFGAAYCRFEEESNIYQGMKISARRMTGNLWSKHDRRVFYQNIRERIMIMQQSHIKPDAATNVVEQQWRPRGETFVQVADVGRQKDFCVRWYKSPPVTYCTVTGWLFDGPDLSMGVNKRETDEMTERRWALRFALDIAKPADERLWGESASDLYRAIYEEMKEES